MKTSPHLLACLVNLLVEEVRLAHESFPTLDALIGLLSSVNLHVSTEIRVAAKGFCHRLCI